MATTHGDMLTTMAVPYGTALQSCWHHTALGITRHVDTGGTGIRGDRLTTMATTRGDTLTTMETTRRYAYDDGRSTERPLHIRH